MTTPLRLFNSLTREVEEFRPIREGEARVYTCGPTVYNYQHIGNMRAYVFADTLGRVLSFKGYDLKHVINITDVGHLTSDADAGDDKMEKAASAAGKSAWDIAAFYQADFENDLERLNVRKPQHPRATDYVPQMIEWAQSIEAKHCYRLDSGLYFDVSTVPDYGRLARAHTDQGESRIEAVAGKRSPLDFAIWRTTPPGETRQMEWDSPWGRGAPGWHLECSVMSGALLGFPFDIHTGGIDHREIHHPCEIAQNQAHEGYCEGDQTGARLWMHNNFLIDRTGKMSKSSGEFLRLQALVDRGFHPLSYRLMCLQAHYRSELEFSWENLLAAQVRLKRMVMGASNLYQEVESLAHHLAATSNVQALDSTFLLRAADITNQRLKDIVKEFETALSDDLNSAVALTLVEKVLGLKGANASERFAVVECMDEALGLNLENATLSRVALRIRPTSATLTEPEIEARLDERKAARVAKDFATSDRIRDELAAAGVEVMDGDPSFEWDWKIEL
ncbi:cysteine--tRNA ligase [Sphingomonas sp. SUN039]|uniref:cysteine--tRNA ligase n=1 Tax=Sphingomonas sp. SUN039 TaxID=2937787 RepID=UPI0021641BD4|nr:cysteine--tRNA ligase [Sphingomonas sp. SUN039]UVO53383.1 cysteine--tRNA ligase [Sphingomonas sp. SUN039]